MSVTAVQHATNILFEMDRLLVQYGWCYGQMRGPQGQFCLVGAYNEAVERSEYKPYTKGSAAKLAKMLVYDTLVHLAKADVNGLPAWNDAERRTKRGVRTLIAQAIKTLQKAG